MHVAQLLADPSGKVLRLVNDRSPILLDKKIAPLVPLLFLGSELVDRHSTCTRRSVGRIWMRLEWVFLLFLTLHFPIPDVWLESLIEVHDAPYGDSNRSHK